MVDQLPTIIGDQGPVEVLPVMLVDSQGDPVPNGVLGQFEPLGYVQITLDAQTVEPADIPAGAVLAIVRVEAHGIRYRDDGVNPTATVGMPVDVGETLAYDAAMADIRMIGQSNGAIVNISFYGRSNA